MINVEKVKPSGIFTNYIFKAIPLAFDESMSYYEVLAGLLAYLKDTILPAVNNNADALAEVQNLMTQLQEYVDNYFTNLDVQEEINNKLDEMVEAGTLQEIIADYLNSKAIFGFDNVQAMKEATNLIDGSYAQTLGYYTKNDGGNGLYKIRNITNDDIVDNGSIIELSNNELIAELINKNDEINIKQYGAKGDGVTNDYEAFNKACNKYKNILIPEGTYLLNQTVNLLNNTNIYGKTAIRCWSGNTDNSKKTEILTTNNYAFTCTYGYVNNFENLSFNGKGIDTPSGSKINKCEFYGDTGVNNMRVTTINECSFHQCTTAGIKTLTDSIITNSYFYNNEIGINMLNSNDNTVCNNKIEWNNVGIRQETSTFNNIVNNTFDRNTTYGIEQISGSNNLVSNNRFERNLTAHIKMNGSLNSYSSNTMYRKNSEDDQSGTIVPTNAIEIVSLSNSIINGNVISATKMFKQSPEYSSNVIVYENTLNGLNTEIKVPFITFAKLS